MKRKLILSALLIYAGNLLQAHPPWGIIVDEQNNIYFADLKHL